MKGKIKVLSLLLALAMVASMFVACGDDTDPVKGGTKDDPNAEVELVWYHWGAEPKNSSPVEEAMNAKSKTDIKTTIDFRWATGNDQRVNTMMATGGDFDIAFTCNWYANYVVNAQNGNLADITDKLDSVPDLKKLIPEQVWNGAKVNGKIYAVPVLKDTAATNYWFANKDYVIDKVGAKAEFDGIKEGLDISSLTPLLTKIKAYADAAPANKYPNDLTAPFNYNWAGLQGHDNGFDLLSQPVRVGIKLDDPNGKVICMYEDPGYIANVKTLKSWFAAGLVNKDATETELEPQYCVVSTGQGFEGAEAFAWGGATKGYTTVIKKKYGPILTTASVQGSMNGISVNSKYVDRSLKYLEYINTNQDYRNMLAYGIEGTNWEKTAAGNTIKVLNDDFAPGSFSQATTLILYPVDPAPADMYDRIKAANEAATPSPLIGFNPDLSKIKNEIAACSAIIEANYKAIQTGNIGDVDKVLADVMKELNAAGMDKIKTEIQTQVDAFKK